MTSWHSITRSWIRLGLWAVGSGRLFSSLENERRVFFFHFSFVVVAAVPLFLFGSFLHSSPSFLFLSPSLSLPIYKRWSSGDRPRHGPFAIRPKARQLSHIYVTSRHFWCRCSVVFIDFSSLSLSLSAFRQWNYKKRKMVGLGVGVRMVRMVQQQIKIEKVLELEEQKKLHEEQKWVEACCCMQRTSGH